MAVIRNQVLYRFQVEYLLTSRSPTSRDSLDNLGGLALSKRPWSATVGGLAKTLQASGCSCPIPEYRVDNLEMQIGQLARTAGVNIQTIRFYEREKLLPPPPRTASGYRDYSQRHLDRILFIRRNHQIGFTLAEVRQLLDLHGALEAMPRPLRRKPAQVKQIITIGRERLAQVNEKICGLQMMRRQLEFLIRHLEESAPTTCPVATQDTKVVLPDSSRQRKTRSAGCPVPPPALRHR